MRKLRSKFQNDKISIKLQSISTNLDHNVDDKISKNDKILSNCSISDSPSRFLIPEIIVGPLVGWLIL